MHEKTSSVNQMDSHINLHKIKTKPELNCATIRGEHVLLQKSIVMIIVACNFLVPTFSNYITYTSFGLCMKSYIILLD